jgi:uncharacterized membrane protein YciS (DUF1049 family)
MNIDGFAFGCIALCITALILRTVISTCKYFSPMAGDDYHLVPIFAVIFIAGAYLMYLNTTVFYPTTVENYFLRSKAEEILRQQDREQTRKQTKIAILKHEQKIEELMEELKQHV